jgi:hypothetical protein
MPTPIIFTLTDAGLNAALDADANGLTLSLTQIGIGSGQYAPLATRTALQAEIARYPLSGGDVEPNSKTLRFSAILESVTTQQAFEVGLFTSTGVLFAVASTTGTDPLILVSANITTVIPLGMVLSEIPAGSVTVVTDPNAPLAVALLAQHAAAANPHPQYTLFNVFIAAINALQEQLDMTQLAAVVTAINAAFTQMNKSLAKVGDVKTTATAMTAAQFTAAQNDGSVWEVYAPGRVIVGAGEVTIDYSAATGEAARPNVTQTFNVGQTGGEIDHKQTTAEMRQHEHHQNNVYNKFAAVAQDVINAGWATDADGLGFVSLTSGGNEDNNYADVEYQITDFSAQNQMDATALPRGDSEPFNVMQPYIVASRFVCVTAATPIPAIVFPA